MNAQMPSWPAGAVRRWLAAAGCLLCVAGCAQNPAVPPPPLPRPIETLSEEPPGPPLPTIQFTVQLGAFSTAERASAFAERLSAAGVDAYSFIDIDGLWKVRFGRFDTKEDAIRHGDALRTRGLVDAFHIVRPTAEGRQIDSLSALREDIVNTARRFIGTPYRWGGESARTGFDCSGLTMTVYRLNGLDLPRSTLSQFRSGQPIARHSLQRGDLVFFKTGRSNRVTHVGIYSGEGKFIHAPGRGKRIRTASLSNGYFAARFVGARRYL